MPPSPPITTQISRGRANLDGWVANLDGWVAKERPEAAFVTGLPHIFHIHLKMMKIINVC